MSITNTGEGEGLFVQSDESYAGCFSNGPSATDPCLTVNNNGSGSIAAEFCGGEVQIWGDLDVTGTLSKSAGSFKIDHPFDPANKYLYHSFVESPDMMNVYNGNVILDNKGEALVELPYSFESINMEFRCPLTCIGGFSEIYIGEEIRYNEFKIPGGKSGLKVSWQVTGIRNDPYANEHRIQVEADKPAHEKGKYLYPELYGQSEEKGMNYKKKLQMIEAMKQK